MAPTKRSVEKATDLERRRRRAERQQRELSNLINWLMMIGIGGRFIRPNGAATPRTPATPASDRLRRNEARSESRIRERHSDVVQASTPCYRCNLERRTCLRRPDLSGKCLTCTTGYCSFFAHRRRTPTLSPTPPSSSPIRPPLAVSAELFQVLGFARSSSGPARDYLIQRARALAKELGGELEDFTREFEGQAEAGGSGV